MITCHLTTYLASRNRFFTYIHHVVFGLHEEPANFLREKRSVAFVTGHLFSFLVVLSLICMVTTQILICENQIIWRLEILLRTIVAALLKTKCNGRYVKNKGYQETGKEYFAIVHMIEKDEGYKYFAAWATFDARSCRPSPPSAHIHTKWHCLPTKRTLPAWWPLPIPPPAHTTLFPISITTNAQVFLSIAQIEKEIYSISLEISYELNSTPQVSHVIVKYFCNKNSFWFGWVMQ